MAPTAALGPPGSLVQATATSKPSRRPHEWCLMSYRQAAWQGSSDWQRIQPPNAQPPDYMLRWNPNPEAGQSQALGYSAKAAGAHAAPGGRYEWEIGPARAQRNAAIAARQAASQAANQQAAYAAGQAGGAMLPGLGADGYWPGGGAGGQVPPQQLVEMYRNQELQQYRQLQAQLRAQMHNRAEQRLVDDVAAQQQQVSGC